MTTQRPRATAWVSAPGCHLNSPGAAPTTYDPSRDLESVCASRWRTTKSSLPVSDATSSSTALLPAPAGPSRSRGLFRHSASATARRFRSALPVRIIVDAAPFFADDTAVRIRTSTPPTRTCPGAAGNRCRSSSGASSSSSSTSRSLRVVAEEGRGGPGFR